MTHANALRMLAAAQQSILNDDLDASFKDRPQLLAV